MYYDTKRHHFTTEKLQEFSSSTLCVTRLSIEKAVKKNVKKK